MRAFTTLSGIAAPLPVANVDTDAIIPKQFLTTTERVGLGRGLFFDWRFDGEGRERPDFVLNREPYRGAQILIAGENFGCGSSREHAPWALSDFGITCVVASRFADIFYNNALKNGVLPAIVPEATAQALAAIAELHPGPFHIDLERQTIQAPDQSVHGFAIEAGAKARLLAGLDEIAESLQFAAAITAFEAGRG
jgi:3-isopropylmalate dehydratase small subunit